MCKYLGITLISATLSIAASPPILSRPLATQLVPNNSAVSSVFPILPSSALLVNLSASTPALRVPPSWSFSIGFFGDTFLPSPGDSQQLSFAAQLQGGNPLPGWLHFDPATLTIWGVAPTQIQSVQVFHIVIIAMSSHDSSISDTFTLIVSLHDLSLTGPLLARNVTEDSKFSIPIDDWQGVQIDGAHASSTGTALALVLNTTSYPWLVYDSSSLTLAGTPPGSYVGVPGPLIPATVTLDFSPQLLTVSTNLTLNVIPSAFTTNTLPPILALPGTSLTFDLSPFVSRNVPQSVAFNAKFDPQNATWLDFNPNTKSLHGTVPNNASIDVKVLFTAHDSGKSTDSRTQLLITMNPHSGDSSLRPPTARSLRKPGTVVRLAVGLVCAVFASIIVLAIVLAFCRRYCGARERVNGVHVMDESVFDKGLKSKGAYEKERVNDNDGMTPHEALLPTSPGGRMITKGAFFNAIHDKLGGSGSWRGRGTPKPGLGNGKKARKSKISKPMAVLSSSTSVRDGFADRAHEGVNKSLRNTFGIESSKGYLLGSKFTQSLASLSLSPEHVVPRGSTGATGVLRRVPDDPPLSDIPPSMGTESNSLGTGTGTQSTFATGESTRLTNSAGEVPSRRPDFNGRHETLAERIVREKNNPGLFPPSRTLLKVRRVDKVHSETVSVPETTLPVKFSSKTSENDRSSSPSSSSKSGKFGSHPRVGGASDTSDHPSSKSSTETPPTLSSHTCLSAPSSYHKVYFGDKGNESDESSVEDLEHAVIHQAVQRTSKETLANQGATGKPRLVAFTHERVPEPVGQVARREVSQKVVVQGNEDSDPDGDMKMGLEYVRQLGYQEPEQEFSRSNARTGTSSRELSNASIEFLASNHSNGSTAGRTRVLSHLVTNPHRPHTGPLLVSSSGGSGIGEGDLPRITLGPAEPFNFAAQLDRTTSTIAGSALQAKQMDGSPLPEWLRFRKIEREFWGVTPKALGEKKNTELVARVVVHIWEAEMSIIVGGCVIDVMG